MRWIAQIAYEHGFSTLTLDPRGCGMSSPGYFHGGWRGDLFNVCQQPEIAAYPTRYLVGFSMGGHVACRLACDPSAQGLFREVFSCCAPLSLGSIGDHIDQRAWRIYRRYLVEGLKPIAERLLSASEDGVIALTERHLDGLQRALEVKTIRGFDQSVTSALLGYKDADAYYETESVIRYLSQLHTPTIYAVNAHDPFITCAEQLALLPLDVLPHLSVSVSPRGGHIYGGHEREDSALGVLTQWLRARAPKLSRED